jgi:hypothetical protein
MASYDQIESALAYLSMIDPEAFEIALTVVTPSPADESEDDEAILLCRTCGAPVAIFPELVLNWRHFRGDATASGVHQTYDPGHGTLAEVCTTFLNGSRFELPTPCFVPGRCNSCFADVNRSRVCPLICEEP